MNLITTTIQPDTWEDLSGPGSVMPYRTGVYVDPNGEKIEGGKIRARLTDHEEMTKLYG